MTTTTTLEIYTLGRALSFSLLAPLQFIYGLWIGKFSTPLPIPRLAALRLHVCHPLFRLHGIDTEQYRGLVALFHGPLFYRARFRHENVDFQNMSQSCTELS